jgi:DHA1 family tetracycline resistance protein-like MFS transporter
MAQRLPIIFIVMTVMIDSMGVGLIMPVMPNLIQEVRGGTIGNAAIWGGILTTSFAAMQFLFSPLLGNLSDRFGRRPILLLSLLVLAADYLVMAVAGSIWLLLAGRIVGGMASATHTTASAYMADISAPSEKARRFGLIGAGFGVGFVFGPILGGSLSEFGTRAPFVAAAILAGANGILGWLVLKETVTDKIRRRFDWRRANPLGALNAVTRMPGLSGLLWVFFFYQVSTFVYPVTWAYFSTERFDWGPGTIGLSLAVFGACYAVVQGVLVRPATQYLGDNGTVLLGLSMETVTLTVMGFVAAGWLAFGMIPVAALAAIGLPALQGIMSRKIPDDAQGELQGVLTSVSSLGMIISPLVMTQIFAYFSGGSAPVYLPGAAFLLAAVLMLISLLLFVTSRRSSATFVT